MAGLWTKLRACVRWRRDKGVVSPDCQGVQKPPKSRSAQHGIGDPSLWVQNRGVEGPLSPKTQDVR